MLVTEILAMIAYVSSKYIKLDDTVQTTGRVRNLKRHHPHNR